MADDLPVPVPHVHTEPATVADVVARIRARYFVDTDVAAALEMIDQRLRALEPCPEDLPGAPHTWTSGPDRRCRGCGVPAPPSVVLAQARCDSRTALYQTEAPFYPIPVAPLPKGCENHPVASLACADCESVVRARVEASAL